MINIYTKSKEEVEKQQADYNFGAQIAKGIPFKACSTYLMKKDGTKVDTKDLSENDIMTLIALDLRDPNSKGKDVFKLLKVVGEQWTPSLDAILQLYQMETVYGHIMRDIMGSIGINAFSDARTIAKFQKESAGDFSPIETADEIAVIQQMKQNQEAKKRTQGMHR